MLYINYFIIMIVAVVGCSTAASNEHITKQTMPIDYLELVSASTIRSLQVQIDSLAKLPGTDSIVSVLQTEKRVIENFTKTVSVADSIIYHPRVKYFKMLNDLFDSLEPKDFYLIETFESGEVPYYLYYFVHFGNSETLLYEHEFKDGKWIGSESPRTVNRDIVKSFFKSGPYNYSCGYKNSSRVDRLIISHFIDSKSVTRVFVSPCKNNYEEIVQRLGISTTK